MPARRYHTMFDELLIEKGVICEGRNGSTVHARLDRGAKKYGASHRGEDDWHNPEMMRLWIDDSLNSLGTMTQDTATDYIRIAWGHVVLDDVVTREKNRRERRTGKRPSDGALDWDLLLKRTWRRYRELGCHRRFYRDPASGW